MTPKVDETLTPTDHPLIGLDARGRPWVFGTNTRVTQIVFPMAAVPGTTVEQYCEDYPHLKPEHVRAALDYYAAHKAEVDEEYRQEREEEERYFRLHDDPVWRAKMLKLKAEWKRPS
ncbi:MAG: DUF433 domain-containing protein [Gemmataceae bacterium]|nr:DUF433 domain-containing protein [Gemmataceae bacterium]